MAVITARTVFIWEAEMTSKCCHMRLAAQVPVCDKTIQTSPTERGSKGGEGEWPEQQQVPFIWERCVIRLGRNHEVPGSDLR
ncbi:hypothetical protein DPX16_10844 [Anabarilius grahami]|uniref:Uncharacterized protein n=1 Tax=Anabarilius grahami TaxID=495550 RepID=A0A3N0Z7X8_ANAGA|nr:hypothetical protein DPX16_10844 [Anabarilius grahami]